MELQFKQQITNLKQNINLIEAIQTLSELAIIGDKKEQDIFDLFIEEKVLDEFVRVLKETKDENIVNAILSQIGMLIINISNNIVVLLSHRQLNEFIIYNNDLSNEETKEYYINFIKMLSLKVTKDNINLFFNQKYTFFPLLLYSQNFYNCNDSLTRTTTHNILLAILKNVPQSPMENLLKSFLQSYPFIQVLVNHVSYMKELLIKWSNDQDRYKEYLLDLHYFFKDLYTIGNYLSDILDNLFMHLIIFPLYQNLGKNDAKLQTQTLLIFHNLFEIKFSQRLLSGIFILMFSPEIPVIPNFQIEINFLPTKDIELLDICMSFFVVKEKNTLGLFQSISQSIAYVPQLFFKDIPKMRTYKSFVEFDLINKLNSRQIFRENLIISDEYTYNQYNIYAILNSLNDQHYSLILSLMEILLMSPQFYPITYGERVTHIINMLEIILNGGEQQLNTINNCLKSISIICALLSDEDKTFYVTFTRSVLLKRIEQHLQGETIHYYRYFQKIMKAIQDNNLMAFSNIAESKQIIRFLLILNVNFTKNWLKNPFKEFEFISVKENIQFNNGQIQLIGQEIKTGDLEFHLNDWIQVIDPQKDLYIKLVHIINSQETLELQFWNKTECKQCISQIYERQQDQEQHAIPQIISQLHKLYY